MAASLPPLNCAPPLSNKQRKAASRKERRKRKRQAIARARECDAQNGAIVDDPNEEMDKEDDDDDASFVLERQRLHDEWLERERLAQEEFLLRSEREEAARKRREDDERKIKEEWEARQRREEQQKEQKQQEKRDREEAVQKMLDEAENQLTNGGPWMNPEAPGTDKSENYGTERDAANCPFFLKTGSCRFGDRCSRKHVYPSTSPTLMIRAMFITYGMEQSQRDDYDGDASLEHSEEDLHESFTEFYHDVLPEFKTVGKVVQFKVSCNYEPHLRGNVYVQFDTEEQCRQAFIKFNGRWYAGKQLHCEICPVTRWKNAICGLFDRKKCPKGKHCNFLHVFRNPGNEFWEADRDLHLSPDHSIKRSQSERYSDRHSERRGDRSRRSHWSRSPPRSERSYGKREDDRRSERSRDRRTSQHQRDDSRRSFRSPRYDRARDRYPSRSREKSRSRSRDRKRSRDQDRNVKSQNKGEERDRNGDTERNKPSREKSKRHSPEKEDEKRRPDEDSKTRRRHKHSKKSKKKSKKKHKKRSCSPEGMTSSRESEDDTEEKGERSQNNEDLSANPSIDAENSSITQVDEHTQSCS
ncbi:U2 small nuclear ribonucleoprotein auxiliary factor 35 kDa subunit-related protein 1 isoform X1 [Phycodurus eques]|uniref:U2 small nuclear ribonucleoprotein auxiliary factor 35 kDa subunit-related protein 1 isoform X1 n=2 Tax=Phycodurus eques TaxID=693459 RepID=UPI002ACD7B94|nr:U2 small nuclear ribonucleoprotein auxiliary factor 35 kDa subunit-related protein 1 isoform X1 [Phycodurus eques]